MPSKSQVNQSLPQASTCPFWNMARTSQKLEVNSAGNVERRLVRNCMMANGLSKTLTYLIDKLSAEHQSNKVGSRQETLNLTSVLNNSPLNHLADMGVVCPESAKVDKQRVNKIIDSLRKISPDGIVDFYSLARLQSQNFRRDREKIVALKLSSFEGEFPEKYVRAYTSVILRFLSATLLPWGELSLMLLVLGHREPLSRRKILHLKELEAFFLHGEPVYLLQLEWYLPWPVSK